LRAGDTIVALSSGALPSGVAVIRLSGPQSRVVAEMLLPGGLTPRRLVLADIRLGGEVLDRGLVAWMPGPHSFTGEDCLELQVHGSPATVRAILREITRLTDTRLAEAGEFTRRAFENGKLDLTEVEALGDLLAAETEGQRRQALARAAGGLSRQLDGWRERLLDARAEIEARLDFSDEGDVEAALPESLQADLQQLRQEFFAAAQSVTGGRIVREGFRVALAGRPNAGKSSLLNALARSEEAIVTDEPGTTRDLKEVPLDINGQLVILIDMAGLRETDSKAEAEGVRRARTAIDGADLVVWLQPVDDPAPDNMIPAGTLTVATKGDLPGAPSNAISTLTGQGVAALLETIAARAADALRGVEAPLVSRERDRLALEAAADAVLRALSELQDEELAAEGLRQASQALERLLGRMDAESVLDRLFLAFCIGK
jgi:tRNA modification GTPase